MNRFGNDQLIVQIDVLQNVRIGVVVIVVGGTSTTRSRRTQKIAYWLRATFLHRDKRKMPATRVTNVIHVDDAWSGCGTRDLHCACEVLDFWLRVFVVTQLIPVIPFR